MPTAYNARREKWTPTAPYELARALREEAGAVVRRQLPGERRFLSSEFVLARVEAPDGNIVVKKYELRFEEPDGPGDPASH